MSDIKWDPTPYTLRSLLETKRKAFPMVVRFEQSFEGKNSVDNVQKDQIFRLERWGVQYRVIAIDKEERIVSIPMDWPIKVKLYERYGTPKQKASKSKKLKEAVKRYNMPMMARFESKTKWRFKVGDAEYTNDIYGDFKIVRWYEEAYVMGNMIEDGSLDLKVQALTVGYNTAMLRIATGGANNSENDWTLMLRRWDTPAARLDYVDLKGLKNILTYQEGYYAQSQSLVVFMRKSAKDPKLLKNFKSSQPYMVTSTANAEIRTSMNGNSSNKTITEENVTTDISQTENNNERNNDKSTENTENETTQKAAILTVETTEVTTSSTLVNGSHESNDTNRGVADESPPMYTTVSVIKERKAAQQSEQASPSAASDSISSPSSVNKSRSIQSSTSAKDESDRDSDVVFNTKSTTKSYTVNHFAQSESDKNSAVDQNSVVDRNSVIEIKQSNENDQVKKPVAKASNFSPASQDSGVQMSREIGLQTDDIWGLPGAINNPHLLTTEQVNSADNDQLYIPVSSLNINAPDDWTLKTRSQTTTLDRGSSSTTLDRQTLEHRQPVWETPRRKSSSVRDGPTQGPEITSGHRTIVRVTHDTSISNSAQDLRVEPRQNLTLPYPRREYTLQKEPMYHSAQDLSQAEMHVSRVTHTFPAEPYTEASVSPHRSRITHTFPAEPYTEASVSPPRRTSRKYTDGRSDIPSADEVYSHSRAKRHLQRDFGNQQWYRKEDPREYHQRHGEVLIGVEDRSRRGRHSERIVYREAPPEVYYTQSTKARRAPSIEEDYGLDYLPQNIEYVDRYGRPVVVDDIPNVVVRRSRSKPRQNSRGEYVVVRDISPAQRPRYQQPTEQYFPGYTEVIRTRPRRSKYQNNPYADPYADAYTDPYEPNYGSTHDLRFYTQTPTKQVKRSRSLGDQSRKPLQIYVPKQDDEVYLATGEGNRKVKNPQKRSKHDQPEKRALQKERHPVPIVTNSVRTDIPATRPDRPAQRENPRIQPSKPESNLASITDEEFTDADDQYKGYAPVFEDPIALDDPKPEPPIDYSKPKSRRDKSKAVKELATLLSKTDDSYSSMSSINVDDPKPGIEESMMETVVDKNDDNKYYKLSENLDEDTGFSSNNGTLNATNTETVTHKSNDVVIREKKRSSDNRSSTGSVRSLRDVLNQQRRRSKSPQGRAKPTLSVPPANVTNGYGKSGVEMRGRSRNTTEISDMDHSDPKVRDSIMSIHDLDEYLRTQDADAHSLNSQDKLDKIGYKHYEVDLTQF